MKKELAKTVVEITKHVAQHQMRHGNHSRALAVCLIGFGLVTLPIPIIGIPLLIAGIVTFARS